MKIKKVLVANRGEIAVRVIRACKDSGIIPVAVYSEADRLSPHVLSAAEAYAIGGSSASESYLDMEKIIGVAKSCGADAIHPGYGFLAENPVFARQVNESGMKFIGPTPEAISSMGDKTVAKSLAIKSNIPVVPGTDEAPETAADAVKLAAEIGYPVLLKAAAGGGGKGMRLVRTADDMEEMFRTSRSEATASFGDGRIFVEKYIEEPHHVEVQIMGDEHGTVVHLGERECSIQRRYQKVIEESPSPTLTPELREEICNAAVRIAKAAKYTNAGTVEFLVDKNLDFFFLEVNTRLQVEHPVTEMRTGIDLAVEQIRIAEGKPLSFSQEEVSWSGSAIECRILAEDSRQDFTPMTGAIGSYIEPGGPGVRVDSGVRSGQEITPYYDPLIAKLIVWGADRNEAIARSVRALSEYIITGVPTTISFCRKILTHPEFIAGNYDTHFVSRLGDSDDPDFSTDEEDIAAIGAAASLLKAKNNATDGTAGTGNTGSPWKIEGRKAGMR